MTDRRTLVLDLDGTLLKTDMLYETFWNVLSRDVWGALSSVWAVREGKAPLKRALALRAYIDVATLPINQDVLTLIRAKREQGIKIALVTASDQILADQIAGHFGVFDEVHGSTPERNLKGQSKAEFLLKRFGAGHFDYVGDSAADLAVWEHAGEAIAVNAPAAVASALQGNHPNARVLSAAQPRMNACRRALRPHQWVKNLLVFLPMIAAHDFSPEIIWQSLAAFVTFCLCASAVYLFNDLLDLSGDRTHPRKRFRPLAAGDFPIASGTVLAVILMLVSLGIAAFLGAGYFLVLLAYIAMTTAYSLVLKRKIIVDICTLAGLYTLRILAGSVATGIPLSVWLVVFSSSIFFSLAAVKRQAELIDQRSRGVLGQTGRGYHVEDVSILTAMAISSGFISVLVMAMYLSSQAVTVLYSQPLYLSGICCVLIYWISRIVLITHRGHMHDDPIVFALKDRTSQICLALMLAFGIASSVL